MTEDELIETMARGIGGVDVPPVPPWDALPDHARDAFTKAARAALSAMRAAGYVPVPVEATQVMVTAGQGWTGLQSTWQRMLAASPLARDSGE